MMARNSIQKTHYDVLSVKEDASYEDIRASYRAAILDCHPDKMQGQFEAFVPDHELQERFLKVQKAWEILSNINSRAAYDKQLKALRQEIEMADDVKFEEMAVEDVGGNFELYYDCRCGDCFSINSIELEEMGFAFEGHGSRALRTTTAASASVVLPCGSCSLKIRLLLDTSC